MTKGENLLKTLRRDGYSEVPMDIALCPTQRKEFEQRLPDVDLGEFFNLGHRSVGIPLEQPKKDFSEYFPEGELPESTVFTPWGEGLSKGSEAAYHMHRKHPPLAGERSLEEITDYPWPKLPEGIEESIKTQVSEIHSRGLAAAGQLACTVWETAWGVRSMEQLMMDMMCEPEKADAVLDPVTRSALQRARVYAEAGCDILHLGDDIGMQQSIMVSLDLWREWLKPRIAEVIDEAKRINPSILIFYHSCGMITPFIPELIEIGVEILNPIQPECMSFEEIHTQFGDRLSFWGTIGTQSTLPFGTPQEVKAEVSKNLALSGDKGGLVIAPTHLVEPEVPWENLLAMKEGAEEFSR